MICRSEVSYSAQLSRGGKNELLRTSHSHILLMICQCPHGDFQLLLSTKAYFWIIYRQQNFKYLSFLEIYPRNWAHIYIFFFSKSKIKTTTVWGRIELFRCLISMEYIKLWSWNTCSLFLSIFLDFFKFWNLENVDVKFIISFPRERWKLNSIWWHQRKLKNTRRD